MKTMIASVRFLTAVMLAVLVAGVIGASCLSQEVGQERARDAFEKGNYPWYDSENDSVNYSPELSEGGAAGTAERNGIRKQVQQRVSRPVGAWVVWLLIGLFVLFVILLVVVLIWLLLKVDRPSGFSQYDSDWENDYAFGSDRVERLPFDVRNQVGDFRAAAEQAYQAGDYRTAVIYLFSHVLLTLDRHKRVRLRKGKTNRQYLGEMRTNGAVSLTDYYERLMVSFESAFFGDYEVSSTQFEESWNALPEFQDRLKQLGEVARG